MEAITGPSFDIFVSSVRQSFATLNTTFCAGRIGFAPLILKDNQVVHSFFLADCLINFLKVSHQCFAVFVADKPCA